MSLSVSGASQQRLLVKLMREAAVANATGAASAPARASAMAKAQTVAPVEPVDASSGFAVSPQVMSFLSRLGGAGGQADPPSRQPGPSPRAPDPKSSAQASASPPAATESKAGGNLVKMLGKLDAVLSAYAANSGSLNGDSDETTTFSF